MAALALPALLPGFAHADQMPSAPKVPDDIRVPDGHIPFLMGKATGTQNYTCQPSSSSSTGFAWTFTGPTATLVNGSGEQIMTHFAVPTGPAWETKNGSRVVGARVAGVTVSTDAIPWLLLKAVSTSKGLSPTTYIQRVRTTGGLTPTSGCDASAVGNVMKGPYTADYYFYKAT